VPLFRRLYRLVLNVNFIQYFSLMNNVNTKARNMMGMNHLDQVMQIKCYLSSGKEAKLDAALGDSQKSS